MLLGLQVVHHSNQRPQTSRAEPHRLDGQEHCRGRGLGPPDWNKLGMAIGKLDDELLFGRPLDLADDFQTLATEGVVRGRDPNALDITGVQPLLLLVVVAPFTNGWR